MHLLIALAMQEAAATQSLSMPSYADVVRRCEEVELKRYPLGTAGYAGVFQACLETEVQALERETGDLIAKGRCSDAVALSLRAGNFQLAAQIRSYCSVPAR